MVKWNCLTFYFLPLFLFFSLFHICVYIYIYIYIYICVCVCVCVCARARAPGSSVGIATDYGLDGPGSNPGGV